MDAWRRILLWRFAVRPRQPGHADLPRGDLRPGARHGSGAVVHRGLAVGQRPRVRRDRVPSGCLGQFLSVEAARCDRHAPGTGRAPLDAADALYAGLATHFVPADRLDAVGDALADNPGDPVDVALNPWRASVRLWSTRTAAPPGNVRRAADERCWPEHFRHAQDIAVPRYSCLSEDSLQRMVIADQVREEADRSEADPAELGALFDQP